MKRELVGVLKITWSSLFNATAEEAMQRVYEDNDLLIGTLQDLGCTIFSEQVESAEVEKTWHDDWTGETNKYMLQYFNVSISFLTENESKLDNFINFVINTDYDIQIER
jgi:hypothetical protein